MFTIFAKLLYPEESGAAYTEFKRFKRNRPKEEREALCERDADSFTNCPRTD